MHLVIYTFFHWGSTIELLNSVVTVLAELCFRDKGGWGSVKHNSAIENFYIFRETKLKNQINDRLTVKQNIIFETIVQEDPLF